MQKNTILKLVVTLMVGVSTVSHAQVANKFAQATLQASQKTGQTNKNQISADSVFAGENLGQRQYGPGVYLQQHYAAYLPDVQKDAQNK
jgi:hypothetical protein